MGRCDRGHELGQLGDRAVAVILDSQVDVEQLGFVSKLRQWRPQAAEPGGALRWLGSPRPRITADDASQVASELTRRRERSQRICQTGGIRAVLEPVPVAPCEDRDDAARREPVTEVPHRRGSSVVEVDRLNRDDFRCELGRLVEQLGEREAGWRRRLPLVHLSEPTVIREGVEPDERPSPAVTRAGAHRWRIPLHETVTCHRAR